MAHARTDTLLVGAAEVDITPPIRTALSGGIHPRISVGIEDPLTIKAVVFESNGVQMAYALFDLIFVSRRDADPGIRLASQRTGIPETQIVWAASHTHTGPYTGPIFGAEEGGVNRNWLGGLREKFAEAVEMAFRSRRPARMSRERGYCSALVHNRRLKFKDGREINTWNLHRGEEAVQCLGSAAPIDPEIGILCFDDTAGAPIAILWHYTLHTNSNFGPRFSADYPGVVAARLRERFGAATVPIFLPGAFADVNPAVPNAFSDGQHHVIGNELAGAILDRLDKRKPVSGPVALAVRKKEVVVPYRDFTSGQEQRIRDSQWSPDAQEVFRQELEIMRRAGTREATTIIQAWRIGDAGFASLPGELFVEWGLKIKAESPFPWTFPVELGGDYLGYLVTEQAWKSGGYESLICRSAKPSVAGVQTLVDVALDLLRMLWKTHEPVGG